MTPVAIGVHRQDTKASGPYLLEGVELATALVYGEDTSVGTLDVAPSASPRDVLESILIEGLQRKPFVVGFSGGRDSSGLLALASYLARREGLDVPIAVTNTFPGDTGADESDWQERLIRHAGVSEWVRRRFTHEMDVIGPIAAPLLRRFGPTFPFNGHFAMPALELATDGTYVTGIGGDELFEPNDYTRVALILTGRLRPQRSDLGSLFRLWGPERLAIRHWSKAIPAEPWLQPEIARLSIADMARTVTRQHLWYSDQICDDIWRERSRTALQRTLRAFAAPTGIDVRHPFQDPRFLRAVASHAGRGRWRGRAAAMQELFGDVLPDALVRRRTKATFDSVFFNEHSRSFVREWDGTGVDATLVDVDRLRKTWEQPSVDPRSLSLLQGAWCFNERRAGSIA